jgi:HlyD family secretion protein
MNDVQSWLGAAFTGLLSLFSPAQPAGFSGYVEADYTYVAPLVSGRLTHVHVKEGDTIAAGAPLFDLDDTAAASAVAQAKAEADAAAAEQRNLETGAREADLEVIRQNLQQAQLTLQQAMADASRIRALAVRGVATSADRDKADTALQQAAAEVRQLNAQLASAELPARPEQIAAAKAKAEAAGQALVQAQTALGYYHVVAPVEGRIDRQFLKAGEVSGPSAPVLSIVRTGDLKLRFFVPEAERSHFAIGARVMAECDGCDGEATATVTYQASEPEFTPPLIYSRDERGRLVFMTEARLDDAGFRPPVGQPVTVRAADGSSR